MPQSKRRISAMMYTDMVGYTILAQKNENLSIALVRAARKVVRPVLLRHGGREVKTMGDAFLVEFPNAVDAVRCAYDIQRAIREFNLSLVEEKRIHLRVGLHVGEVVEDRGDILGDAVNIASRVESLAEDGGVCLTSQVHDHVYNKLELRFESLGPKELKHVLVPVEVFKMVMPWEGVASASTQLDRRRVAVLPFANMSPEKEEGYFADGMTEELITTLSGVKHLTVIARTSVMAYRDTAKTAKDIGTELGVGTLVEGSVRKAGNRVRITAQMIDAATEGHTWAQSYDRELQDVFAIQSEIASRVAGELRLRLVDSETRAIEKRPTESTEAYTSYLRGRQLLREETKVSLGQAIVLLQEAISLDPAFARAYVSLAHCHLELADGGYAPFGGSMREAELALKKALDLDPGLAEAHAVFASYYAELDDVGNSEAEAKRALDLNPSLPEAYRMIYNAAFLKQDPAAGLKGLEACYALDPYRPRYIEALGRYYFYLGREDDAKRHWKKTHELAPAGTNRSLTEYHLHRGELDEARGAYSIAANLEPTHWWLGWMEGFLAARGGDRGRALEVIERLESNPERTANINDLGLVYYALGDLDRFFECVNRAWDLHVLATGHVMYCPLFEEGRKDPRYFDFVNRVREETARPRRPD